MKKFFRFLGILVVCIMCVFLIRQYNDQSSQNHTENVAVEDIEKALIEAGYGEAHKFGTERVILDYTETDYVSRSCLLSRDLPEFVFTKSRNDIPKILDAVMPLYDKQFRQGDGELVMKKLIASRNTFLNYNSGDKIVFNGYKYDESLAQPNGFTDRIMVGYN